MMNLGIEEARKTMNENIGGPFGAVITDSVGNVIAVSSNTVLGSHDPTAHAEINAIRKACSILKTHDLSGLGFLKKISMLRKTRAEEKSGARVLGRLFDKNKALEAGKKERNSDKKDNVMDNYKRDEEMKKKIEKAKEETLKSDKYARVISKEADLKKTGKVNMDTKYKIDNKGNIIENKAKESYKKAMDEQQEKTAEDVKKIMDEKESSK